MSQYNGWTNYATWRVKLEIISGMEFEEQVYAEYLKEITEDCVFSNYEMHSGSHLIEDYARAFIDKVNYYEIAEHINEEIDLQIKNEY